MTSLKEKAKKVEIFLLDVDGVLTDGRIVYGPSDMELKFFDVKDGHGIKLLQRAGVKVGIITGRSSSVVSRRASELGIEMVYQSQHDKVLALEKILQETGSLAENVAYVGDDIVDVPIMRRVGFSASVSDAVKEAREVADYVSRSPGGRGAVREIIELILRHKGEWEKITEKYRK